MHGDRVLYAASIGCDYVVMNDVDHVPTHHLNTHEYPAEPLHLCTATDMKGFTFYDTMVGGAMLISIQVSFSLISIEVSFSLYRSVSHLHTRR